MSEVRFQFGQNWESFSGLLDDERLLRAEERLSQLLGRADLSGARMLDIGCGSGLHALAALRLGAHEVVALDIDPKSASTTRSVLDKFWKGTNFAVEQRSVFDLEERPYGQFDLVYSWGVLHHTGAMDRAIRIAADQVRPGGHLALALYGKTPYCGLWTRIKRWYVGANPRGRAAAEHLYVWLFGLYLLLRGRRLSTHIASYSRKRGMDFYHDVRDWVGGYPYESIAPRRLAQLLTPLGFDLVSQNVRRRSGLFGSGNDEYLFRKSA